MNCPNCNRYLTCSCKLRTASDGKKVCDSCLKSYENSKLDKTKAVVTDANPWSKR